MRRNCRRAARLDQTMLNAHRSSTGMASAAMKEPIRFAGRYGVVVTHLGLHLHRTQIDLAFELEETVERLAIQLQQVVGL